MVREHLDAARAPIATSAVSSISLAAERLARSLCFQAWWDPRGQATSEGVWRLAQATKHMPSENRCGGLKSAWFIRTLLR